MSLPQKLHLQIGLASIYFSFLIFLFYTVYFSHPVHKQLLRCFQLTARSPFVNSVLITMCIPYSTFMLCVCHCLLLRPGPGIEAEKIRTRADWITMPFAGLQHYVKALLAWFGVTSKQIPAWNRKTMQK